MQNNHDEKKGSERFRHPPGTVQLFSRQRNTGKNDVTRLPKPSNDPNDPLTWPMWRKCLNFSLLSAMTMSIFTGVSIQHLVWAPMRKELHVSTAQLVQASATMHAAEAVTCIIFIPFAAKYGRRLVYIISTTVFTGALWWTAYMRTLPELYLTNFIMGMAAAVNETAIQMSIRDLFFIHQRGSANSIYFITLKCGHYLTPLAAGAQATAVGWRSSYRTLSIFMTVLVVLFVLGFEETKYVRSSNHSGEKDPESLDLEPEASTQPGESSTPAFEPFPRCLRLQLLTPTRESLLKMSYRPLFTMMIPQVLFTATVFGSGLSLTRVVSSMKSIVFAEEPYYFTPQQLGLLNLGPLIGSLAGAFYGGWLNDKSIVWFARRNSGLFEPEMRLYTAPLPAVAMAAGLVIFGVTADRGAHWIYPSIGSGLAVFGFSSIGAVTFTLVIDSYPNIVPQAFIVVTFFRNALALVTSFSLNPWRASMSVSMVFVVAAVISLVIHAAAVPLVIWGKKWRAASAGRYHKLSNGGSERRAA